jgi:hypothetical protein
VYNPLPDRPTHACWNVFCYFRFPPDQHPTHASIKALALLFEQQAALCKAMGDVHFNLF